MKRVRWVFKIGCWLVGFGGIGLAIATPAAAAEQIELRYGPFGRSLLVSDLEAFAETGEIKGSLQQLSGWLSPGQQQALRGGLTTRFEVDPVMVSQFSYTASGEQLLREIGDAIQTPSGQNGLYSIRAAIILAAADPEGFSPLNVLRHFPTDLRINGGRLLGRVRQFFRLLKQTEQTVAALEQETQAIAATEPPVDYSQLPDLREPGAFTVTVETISFYDETRDRTLITDLYLPDFSASSEPASVPVIVISNGLGARRDRFDELALHLASYGFAVAIPDHPGSDRERLLAFYQGLYRENFDSTEYRDRPQDISFLLDRLEQLNGGVWGDRLNLEQVGVFGYSFGGTTALSLAGAQIDPDYLQQACETQLAAFNISLLYQCRALSLPEATVSMRDERVKAVFLFYPFGKSLFGETGMRSVEIPVFWQATDQDILTPLMIEQVPAFERLPGTEHYLAVSARLPHARVTFDLLGRFAGTTENWATLRAITQNYQKALSTAFFSAYLHQNELYQPYLQATYALSLSEIPFSLSLVRTPTLQAIENQATQSR